MRLQIKSYTVQKILEVFNNVADPHQLNADTDPAFHFNADPDPAFHFNADPEQASLQSDGNLNLRQLVGLHFEPPGCHCERPWPAMALF
jgi:hypothetical protein